MNEEENRINRNSVDMDYTPLESIPNTNQEQAMFDNSNANVTNNVTPTSSNEEVSVNRNEINVGFVDLEKKEDENEEVTQEELDENINSATKLNEAGKKEIRMEVDPIVTKAHNKDNKIKKYVTFGLIVIVLIVGFIIFKTARNNNQKAYYNNIKAAAISYIKSEDNKSLLSSLYLEKVNEITVNLTELKNGGYFEKDLKDPITKEDTSKLEVIIYLNGGNVEAKIKDR